MDTGRRAGLEAHQTNACRLQTLGKGIGGGHAVGTFLCHRFTGDGAGGEIGAGSEDYRICVPFCTVLGDDTAGFALFIKADLGDLRLPKGEVRRVFQHFFHVGAVEESIRLHSLGVNGRTLAQIQRPRLERDLIGGIAHLAAQCIDFVDQMTLARAANGRIAGHIAYRIQRQGE